MSNNEAEQHGVDILNKGAGLIDKMRGNKRNWNSDQMSNQTTQDRRNVPADNKESATGIACSCRLLSRNLFQQQVEWYDTYLSYYYYNILSVKQIGKGPKLFCF